MKNRATLISLLMKCPKTQDNGAVRCPLYNMRHKLQEKDAQSIMDYVDSLAENEIDNIVFYHKQCSKKED